MKKLTNFLSTFLSFLCFASPTLSQECPSRYIEITADTVKTGTYYFLSELNVPYTDTLSDVFGRIESTNSLKFKCSFSNYIPSPEPVYSSYRNIQCENLTTREKFDPSNGEGILVKSDGQATQESCRDGVVFFEGFLQNCWVLKDNSGNHYITLTPSIYNIYNGSSVLSYGEYLDPDFRPSRPGIVSRGYRPRDKKYYDISMSRNNLGELQFQVLRHYALRLRLSDSDSLAYFLLGYETESGFDCTYNPANINPQFFN